ncbi:MULTISPECIES: hypothetical protein [unclassified Arthrobacter]|uniref:hypothetical protein n=1 Tax=unclassified Arthrobacter TaxID=235627 RepID=UPI002106A15B|nr:MULTISPECIES: hypothetical protein [unclassified Arthrobacter]MCQ1947256.1 hypothetical protein [Arthrobacter sp. zg-Y1116]MCQ1986596.1 hypothetical protein [Arthrobacter sp. zg-Y844]MCQ1995257.1 hypothetical protein [Arthrobacter sp. zg-Y1171]UWX80703.1 hypothetical protein N2L00_09665 [Arthrobacter sp. zg-Y1171]
MTNGPESAPRRSRRAADVPVDSPAGPRERESQQRARDREALRAYKALAETPERRDPETAPPTRRQLRLQQQQRAAAAGTGAGSAELPADVPASPEATGPVSSEPSPPAPAGPSLRRERRRQSSLAGTDAEPESQVPEPKAPQLKASERQVAETQDEQELSSRASRKQSRRAAPALATPAVTEGPAAGPAAGTDPNADVEGMSVEQALAARQALEGQARNHVAAMEALQVDDPQAVDLELLAQQKALAERAKVLNRRTRAIEKLSQENEQRKPSPSDPSTAHNLAMVTPLEFVKVPGMEHPVMKAPQTSHIPIVTSSTPVVDPEAAAARPLPAVPAQRPASVPRRVPVGATDVRHSRILARADALVNKPVESEEAAAPIGARSAFGLDPLDVMTAGLGRTRRLRFAAAGVAGLGTLALIVGVLMIVGGLGG